MQILLKCLDNKKKKKLDQKEENKKKSNNKKFKKNLTENKNQIDLNNQNSKRTDKD